MTSSRAANGTAARLNRWVVALGALAVLEPTASESAQLRACLLLQPKEIASVQGEAPKELKPSEHREGSLQVQDCVFVLPTYPKSISLQVTRGPLQAIRARWKATFHPAGKRKSSEEEDRLEPEALRALGEESFWLDVPPSGVLYVLRPAAILRISVGGPGARSVKLKQAVRLARKALRRL